MTLELVLITGMSGSGKSVALHALEDAGYYCVDNLPPELLLPFVELEQHKQADKVAIAMDVRSAQSLPTGLGVLPVWPATKNTTLSNPLALGWSLASNATSKLLS